MDINTFPKLISPADVGRRIASVRGIDWEWRTPPEGTVVAAVQICYCPAGVVIAIKVPGRSLLWYDYRDIRLAP